jgi:hypothetical protein
MWSPCRVHKDRWGTVKYSNLEGLRNMSEVLMGIADLEQQRDLWNGRDAVCIQLHPIHREGNIQIEHHCNNQEDAETS